MCETRKLAAILIVDVVGYRLGPHGGPFDSSDWNIINPPLIETIEWIRERADEAA